MGGAVYVFPSYCAVLGEPDDCLTNRTVTIGVQVRIASKGKTLLQVIASRFVSLFFYSYFLLLLSFCFSCNTIHNITILYHTLFNIEAEQTNDDDKTQNNLLNAQTY